MDACSVLPYSEVVYSEVSSGDYILKQVLFEGQFINPLKKQQKLGVDRLQQNFISSNNGLVKSTETRQGGKFIKDYPKLALYTVGRVLNV